MSQRTIIFSSPEDVLNFVRTVEKYPYDMDLESGRAVVDAKSLLGLMNLGLNKEIELKVYDENCQDLFDEISEYFATIMESAIPTSTVKSCSIINGTIKDTRA